MPNAAKARTDFPLRNSMRMTIPKFAVGEGKADLDAMQERRSVRPLLVAGAKFLQGDAACLEAVSGRERDLAARVSGSLKILGKGRVIDSAGARPARLSLIGYPSPSGAVPRHTRPRMPPRFPVVPRRLRMASNEVPASMPGILVNGRSRVERAVCAGRRLSSLPNLRARPTLGTSA